MPREYLMLLGIKYFSLLSSEDRYFNEISTLPLKPLLNLVDFGSSLLKYPLRYKQSRLKVKILYFI
tara:strand:+ start:1177 stop:1374 length:198 start_codon:yes stop_codon:yes gene_type:complete